MPVKSLLEKYEQKEAYNGQGNAKYATMIENLDRNIGLLIAKLKEKGENNHFRIGTSLYRLIISRSVEHELRDDQKRIMIDTIALNHYEIIFSDGFKKYREYRISDLADNRLTKLL